MSHTLNAEILEKVRGSLAAMTGSARILVGLTMSPAVEAALKRQMPPASVVTSYRSAFPFGVPIIVDPRMNSRSATAYYDRKIWRKRLKEQNRYDRRTYRQNVQALAPSMAHSVPESSDENSKAIGGCQQRSCSASDTEE